MASLASVPSGVQFLRSASLLLSNGTDVIDLSNLRFKFEITANDVETPNTARIRVYNLSTALRSFAISEFKSVSLSAGYQNNESQIFTGTVKQFRSGRERNVDSFLEILAADGDQAYNLGLINASLAAGSTPAQQLKTFAAAAGVPVDPRADGFLTTGGILPRGKVMFGLARDYFRDLANTNQCRWSIQNGVATLIPFDSFLPGTIVEMNSASGLIGVPEATDQGIIVECLLNPKIQVGCQLKINNADITSTTIKEQFFPGYTDLNLIAGIAPPSAANDGLYRVLVVEHQGDTRDTEWYSRITCLLIQQGAQNTTNPAVLPYG